MKTTDDNSIGKRIAELRAAKGISQKELAERTGMLQPNIARIENGHKPSLNTLEAIAEVLGCEIDFVELE